MSKKHAFTCTSKNNCVAIPFIDNSVCTSIIRVGSEDGGLSMLLKTPGLAVNLGPMLLMMSMMMLMSKSSEVINNPLSSLSLRNVSCEQ